MVCERAAAIIPRMTDTPKLMLKFIFIGDTNVGKTSLLTLFRSNKVVTDTRPSLGSDFETHSEIINNEKIQLFLWDCSGQEKFRGITRTFLNQARGVLLIYSVTDRKSFEDVVRWIKDVENNCSHYVLALIGNKIDLPNRTVSTEEGRKLAREFKVRFFETSLFPDKLGEEGQPIRAIVREMVIALMEQIKTEKPEENVMRQSFKLGGAKKASGGSNCC